MRISFLITMMLLFGVTFLTAKSEEIFLPDGHQHEEGRDHSGDDGIPDYFQKLHREKVLSDSSIIWQQLAPGSSGYCEVVEYHPTDPDCIMMSPDMYNGYGSWDNGNTWHTIKDCDGNGDDLKGLRDFAFFIGDPDFGLALDVRGSLWATLDRGRSWQEQVSFNGSFDKGRFSVVEIDPSDKNIIYIGGGDFWNVKANNRNFDSPHHASYQVWNGIAYGEVWRSDDGGKTWQLKNAGIHEDADIGRIWIHPEKSWILYAATSHGIYKSTNRGNYWVNIGSGLPHNMIRDMAVHYDTMSQNLTLYVIDQVFWEDDGDGSIRSSGGVFKSTDSGATWTDINANLFLDFTDVSSFVTDYYYRQLAAWFEISQSEARARYPKKPKAILQVFNRLLLDPSNPSRLYLGHNLRHDNSIYPGDLWMTTNGGRSWTSCARIGQNWNGADKDFWTERGNPVDVNMTFAHLREEVIEAPYPWTGCRALTVNSRGDVIGVFEQQTLQSTNHGQTWMQIDDIETSPGSGHWVGTGDSNLPGRPILMDRRMPGKYLLMSGEHGLWKTVSDGNKIWPGAQALRQMTGQIEEGHGALSISTVAVHPQDTSIIYMLMFRQFHAGYLRKTMDGGKNWSNISHPVNVDKLKPGDFRKRVHQKSLIIDKNNPEQMYFCVPSWILNDVGDHRPYFDEFGVYRSADEGYHWERANYGLPDDYAVNNLCFGTGSLLYAAVMQSYDGQTNGGLYVSRDRAASWQPISIPEAIESVNHVHVDTLTGKIYIACGLKTGSVESGGVWVSPDQGYTWEKIFHMPLVFKVTTAPYDSTRIAVSVGPGTAVDKRNPGAYISIDNGQSWVKANKGLGQPDRLMDLQFDLENPKLLWSALWGSGWYKGEITDGVIAKADHVVAVEGEEVVLDASSSQGDNLEFFWNSPPGIQLTDSCQALTSFTAPHISRDTVLSFLLSVSKGLFLDSVQVNVYIRKKEFRVQFCFEHAISHEAIDALPVIFSETSYFSDVNGKIYVEVNNASKYHVRTSPAHFEPLERYLEIAQDTVMKFILYPKAYDITFFIRDAASQNPLDSALLSISGEEFLTDSTGKVELTLPYAEYPFSVSKGDYMTADSMVVAESARTIEIDMERTSTAVEDNGHQNAVRLYPNPSADKVTVSGFLPGTKIRLVDLKGRTFFTGQPPNMQWHFDASVLSSGLYFILLKDYNPMKFIRN